MVNGYSYTVTNMYTYSEEMFSDLHKDAWGFRPRNHKFYTASPDAKQAYWDEAARVLENTIAIEREHEQRQVDEFRQRVHQLIECGAGDRKVAIRWIIESLDVNSDWDFAAYKLGIPYDHSITTEIKHIIQEMNS